MESYDKEYTPRGMPEIRLDLHPPENLDLGLRLPVLDLPVLSIPPLRLRRLDLDLQPRLAPPSLLPEPEMRRHYPPRLRPPPEDLLGPPPLDLMIGEEEEDLSLELDDTESIFIPPEMSLPLTLRPQLPQMWESEREEELGKLKEDMMQAVGIISPSTKSTEPSPDQYQTVLRSQCQVVPKSKAKPFVCDNGHDFLPSPLAFDPSKLKPIDLSVSIPETRLASGLAPLRDLARDANPMYASSGSWSREIAPSYCHSRSRLFRKQTLNGIGLPSESGEKKLLSALRSADGCKVRSLLFEEGVNPNAADSKKRTALHIATAAGRSDMVCLLVASRADPNLQDSLGNTPLHLAACRGDSFIVSALLGAGANANIKDNRGQSPLNLVWSRLQHNRKDKSISTEGLAYECNLILKILKTHGSSQSIDEICNMMKDVSTREQVDVIMDKMADLEIAKAS